MLKSCCQGNSPRRTVTRSCWGLPYCSCRSLLSWKDLEFPQKDAELVDQTCLYCLDDHVTVERPGCTELSERMIVSA